MTSAVYNANDPYEQLIAQMIRIESQPQFVLRERKSTQEVYRAVLNDFDSALSSLHTALEGLTDIFANPFAARAASVPEGAGFGATATDDAVPGAHTLTVEQLASADSRVSQRLPSAGTSLRSFFDSNGVQTFSIEVASPTDDEPDRRVPVAVTVLPVGSTDSEILGEIRQAITDAMGAAVADETITAEAAASASVVNETTDTARLSLRSGDTGYDNRLGFTDSDSGLLALLELDQTAVTTGEGGGALTSIGTSETDSGLNARFVLDGLTLYRASNDVDDALDGVNLTLQAPGAATTFSIGTDGDAVVKDVEGFIQKYNAVLDFIKRKSAIDPDAGTRGQFASDTTVRGLRFGMRSDLIGTVSGQPEGFERLTDLGIEINDDGTLALADRDALLGAVERDASAVQQLFSAEDGGLATKLQAQLDRFLGTNGMLKARKDVADERIRRLDTSIDRWDERLERRESVLRQQFAQLQEVVALLQGQQGTLDSLFYGGF